jgi:hypothetical protein
LGKWSGWNSKLLQVEATYVQGHTAKNLRVNRRLENTQLAGGLPRLSQEMYSGRAPVCKVLLIKEAYTFVFTSISFVAACIYGAQCDNCIYAHNVY